VTGRGDELDALRGLVLDGARLAEGDDVLDLGDHSGFLAADVGARIGDGWVYAVARDVETLEELLRSAHEQQVAGVAYLVGDPVVLPLPDASVDAAVGGGAFFDVGEAAGAAAELCRVLRPGGRLSLVEGGDAAELTATLREAGFLDIAVVNVPRPDAESGTEVVITARKP
jgi:ubiquinone/menaquinone biosynthesis C-methylase UbiE